MQGKTADAGFDLRGGDSAGVLLCAVVGVSDRRDRFAAGGGLDAAARINTN